MYLPCTTKGIRSERWDTQRSQTAVQQPPVYVNIVRYESLKRRAEVGQVTSSVKCFEETDAAANLKPFLLGQLPRFKVIEEYRISMDFLAEKDCTQFPDTKTKLRLRCQQARLILKWLHLDPFGLGYL